VLVLRAGGRPRDVLVGCATGKGEGRGGHGAQGKRVVRGGAHKLLSIKRAALKGKDASGPKKRKVFLKSGVERGRTRL